MRFQYSHFLFLPNTIFVYKCVLDEQVEAKCHKTYLGLDLPLRADTGFNQLDSRRLQAISLFSLMRPVCIWSILESNPRISCRLMAVSP